MKKVFIFVCGLKVLSAAIGYWFSSVWIFGTTIPLGLMVAYIVIGLKFRGQNLSDAKFADSCYYLGFIFTVFSIVICLFDIRSIGTDLTPIAVRFGAAMISTVFGIAVRVAMVSFKQSTEDAVSNVEDQLVDASRKLTDEFEASFNQLQMFRAQVATASVETIASVKTELKALTDEHNAKLGEYFELAAKQHSEAFLGIVQDVKTASLALASAVDGYCAKSAESIQRLEDSIDKFGDHAMQRLEQVTFPDDLFTSKLNPSVDSLSSTTDSVSSGVRALAEDVKGAAKQVATSIRQINTKTESLDQSVELVHGVIEQQKLLLGSMQDQNDTIIRHIGAQHNTVTDSLEAHRQSMGAGLMAQNDALSSIVTRMEAVQVMVGSVGEALGANTSQSAHLQSLLEESRASTAAIVHAFQAAISPLVDSINSTSLESAQLRRALADAQETNDGLGRRLEEQMSRIGSPQLPPTDPLHTISESALLMPAAANLEKSHRAES